MNKRAIIATLVLLLLLLAGGLSYLTFGKIQRRQHAEVTRQTLPTLSVWATDSTQVQYTPPYPNQPTVVVYFNSECSICQYEAQAIYQDSIALQDANIVMLSSEPLAAIQAFGSQYGLDQRANVQLFGIDPVVVTQAFGAVSAPSILIYNSQRQLVQYYRGETSTEAIAQHL